MPIIISTPMVSCIITSGSESKTEIIPLDMDDACNGTTYTKQQEELISKLLAVVRPGSVLEYGAQSPSAAVWMLQWSFRVVTYSVPEYPSRLVTNQSTKYMNIVRNATQGTF
jgi:hypothetical protein